MPEQNENPGKRRKVGEERTQISPGTRRKITHHDGKTREIPDHKKKKGDK